MKSLIAIILGTVVIASASNASAAELLMFDSPVCEWCESWEADLGEVYPLTAEGKRAPLKRIALHRHKRHPGPYAFVTGVIYTPTFVLVSEGREVGRIQGYPGEDHFWGLLGALIKKLPPPSRACMHKDIKTGEQTC